MTLNPRLSFFATVLCALAFLFVAPEASAAKKKEKVVGSIKIKGNGTVTVNGKTERSGVVLHCGDLIETTEDVKAEFTGGPAYIIDAGTRLRLTCTGSGPVQFVVSYGGLRLFDNAENVIEQIPYNAALGIGNNTFPSIGGGGSSSTGGKIPIFNASGVLIGYALTDSNGKVIAYTNTTGGVLAVTPPNGTPVSSVFGAGATGANVP